MLMGQQNSFQKKRSKIVFRQSGVANATPLYLSALQDPDTNSLPDVKDCSWIDREMRECRRTLATQCMESPFTYVLNVKYTAPTMHSPAQA